MMFICNMCAWGQDPVQYHKMSRATLYFGRIVLALSIWLVLVIFRSNLFPVEYNLIILSVNSSKEIAFEFLNHIVATCNFCRPLRFVRRFKYFIPFSHI